MCVNTPLPFFRALLCCMYDATAESYFFSIGVLKLAISDHTALSLSHFAVLLYEQQNGALVSVLKWNSSDPPVCYSSFTMLLSVVKVIWLFQTVD